jgi:putative membrane protein
MKGFILSIVASAIAFAILLQFLPNNLVQFKGDTVQLVILALGVGVVNAVIKPIVKILSFPVSLMTLGLAGLVINAALMLAAAYAANAFADISFTIGGFPGAITSDTIVGAFVLSVLLGILSAVVGLFVKD